MKRFGATISDNLLQSYNTRKWRNSSMNYHNAKDLAKSQATCAFTAIKVENSLPMSIKWNKIPHQQNHGSYHQSLCGSCFYHYLMAAVEQFKPAILDDKGPTNSTCFRPLPFLSSEEIKKKWHEVIKFTLFFIL